MMWISSVATVTALAAFANAQLDNAYSPPRYPSPWARGGNGWQDAYAKAQQFVSQLTLLEKVNLTTGVGWEGQACVGTTGSIPRLNFAGLCMQDSPLGVRDSKFWSISMDVLIADNLCSRFRNQPFSLFPLLDFVVLGLPKSVSSSRLLLFIGNMILIR
jgi:hypothetical protein